MSIIHHSISHQKISLHSLCHFPEKAFLRKILSNFRIKSSYEINTHYVMLMTFVEIVQWRKTSFHFSALFSTYVTGYFSKHFFIFLFNLKTESILQNPDLKLCLGDKAQNQLNPT